MLRWRKGQEVPDGWLPGERLLAVGVLAPPLGGEVRASTLAVYFPAAALARPGAWRGGNPGAGLTAPGQPAAGAQATGQDGVADDRCDRFRVPWERVVRASWSQEFLDLVVPVGSDPARELRLRFALPGEVPAVVRERVTWTMLVSQAVDVELADGRRAVAQLTARRSPHDGATRWTVSMPRGVDLADPQWQAAADRAVQMLAGTTGIS